MDKFRCDFFLFFNCTRKRQLFCPPPFMKSIRYAPRTGGIARPGRARSQRLCCATNSFWYIEQVLLLISYILFLKATSPPNKKLPISLFESGPIGSFIFFISSGDRRRLPTKHTAPLTRVGFRGLYRFESRRALRRIVIIRRI